MNIFADVMSSFMDTKAINMQLLLRTCNINDPLSWGNYIIKYVNCVGFVENKTVDSL
jgi:hypothetical protein